MSRNKKKRNQAGKAGIAYIVVFLLIIISAKIVMLYQKDQAYREREAELDAIYQEETERRDELSDYEEYMGSREYIEDTARRKLGLIYDNEMIFKEQ